MFTAVDDFGARKKYNNLKHDTSGSIFPTTPKQRSNPHPREGFTNQIPHSSGTENSQMAEFAPGGEGGMLKFRFDRRITFALCLLCCTVKAVSNDREEKRYAGNDKGRNE